MASKKSKSSKKKTSSKPSSSKKKMSSKSSSSRKTTTKITTGTSKISKLAPIKATQSTPTDTQNTGSYYSSALAELQANPIEYQQERALTDTSLLGGQQLSGMYGITYDRNEIENILNNATNAAYVQEFNEQKVNEDNFYNELASTAATQYDQARQDRGAAIMSGASAGARAANELSNMLGVSQNSADAISQLAQQRKSIQDAKAAAIAQNAANAIDKANAAGEALGQLDMSQQANMVNKYTADSEYNAQIKQNNANMWSTAVSALMGAKATRDSSAIAGNATKEAAALQATGDQNAAYLTALGNQNSAVITGNATTQAAKTSAGATRDAAAKSAAAQVRAAQIGASASSRYSGGSRGSGSFSSSGAGSGKKKNISSKKKNSNGTYKKVTYENAVGDNHTVVRRKVTTTYDKAGNPLKADYSDYWTLSDAEAKKVAPDLAEFVAKIKNKNKNKNPAPSPSIRGGRYNNALPSPSIRRG